MASFWLQRYNALFSWFAVLVLIVALNSEPSLIGHSRSGASDQTTMGSFSPLSNNNTFPSGEVLRVTVGCAYAHYPRLPQSHFYDSGLPYRSWWMMHMLREEGAGFNDFARLCHTSDE